MKAKSPLSPFTSAIQLIPFCSEVGSLNIHIVGVFLSRPSYSEKLKTFFLVAKAVEAVVYHRSEQHRFGPALPG